MKIACPDHDGLISVDVCVVDRKNVRIMKVVECPVCDDEVMIDGIYDLDSEGLATPVN